MEFLAVCCGFIPYFFAAAFLQDSNNSGWKWIYKDSSPRWACCPWCPPNSLFPQIQVKNHWFPLHCSAQIPPTANYFFLKCPNLIAGTSKKRIKPTILGAGSTSPTGLLAFEIPCFEYFSTAGSDLAAEPSVVGRTRAQGISGQGGSPGQAPLDALPAPPAWFIHREPRGTAGTCWPDV